MFISLLYLFLPPSIKFIYGGVILLYSFFLLLNKDKIAEKELFYFILAIFSFFVIRLVNMSFSFAIFYLISNFFVLHFLINSKFNIKTLVNGYYLLSLIFLWFLIHRYDPGILFVGTSRNFVSVIFITYTILIYSIIINQKYKIIILPAFLCLLFSFYGIGRSGIIVSMILFSSISFFYIKQLNLSIRILCILIMILFVVFVLYNISNLLNSSNIPAITWFVTRGLESNERDSLRASYLENITFKTLLIGYDYTSNPLFIKFKTNPHNSYIRLHSLVGYNFIIFFIICIIAMFKSLKKRNALLLLLMLCLLLRSWSDIVLFFDKYDFIFYYLLFLAYKRNKKKNYLYNARGYSL